MIIVICDCQIYHNDRLPKCLTCDNKGLIHSHFLIKSHDADGNPVTVNVTANDTDKDNNPVTLKAVIPPIEGYGELVNVGTGPRLWRVEVEDPHLIAARQRLIDQDGAEVAAATRDEEPAHSAMPRSTHQRMLARIPSSRVVAGR